MNNKLIVSVIGVTLGLILTGSVLVPVLSDAERTSGEIVTYDNLNGRYGADAYYMTEGSVSATMGPEGVLINGVLWYDIGTQNTRTIFSEAFALLKTPGAATGAIIFYDDNNRTVNINTSSSFSLSASNGAYTVEVNGAEYTGTYSKVYYEDLAGTDYILLNIATTAHAYVSSIDDVFCGGFYSTGALDTPYLYEKGVGSTSVENYVCSATYSMALVDGTTDIYDLKNFNIVITDGESTESFNPYVVVVPATVSGHKINEATTSLFMAIPVLVILALLMMAATTIRSRN